MKHFVGRAMHLAATLFFLGSLALYSLAGWGDSSASNTAVTSTASPTVTPSPSATPSPTATATPAALHAFAAALFAPAHTPTPTVTPTPTITPTPTPTATPGPGPEWLSYFNLVRSHSDLLPLVENPDWSLGDMYHGRYMVKNDYVGHDEDPANPWYTPEGHAAGQNGNVVVSSWLGTSDRQALDWWLTAPFHAISMLDPQLATTGFGAYREAIGLWEMGATLDVGRGRGPLPPGTTFPIFFPGEGTTASWLQFGGNEWPDPLGGCPGYAAPTGPPLLVQLGDGGGIPQVADSTLSVDGQPVDHCRFDESTFTHPDAGQQAVGRLILANRDAVVLLPRSPFAPGQSIVASVTADGSTHAWQFTVATSARPLPGLVRLGR